MCLGPAPHIYVANFYAHLPSVYASPISVLISHEWKYIMNIFRYRHIQEWTIWRICKIHFINTVPERKFITKTRVRYHDRRWWKQQPERMFTPRFLLFSDVFHLFDARYRAIVSNCLYLMPESVIEFDKTPVDLCTRNTEDLGTSSAPSWSHYSLLGNDG